MSLSPPVARYQQVADQLRAAIARGDYQPGAALPTEAQLMKQYGLSRTTIRQALGLLRSEGLIVALHGSGTFVRERSSVTVPLSRYGGVLRPDSSLGPWEAACKAQGIPGHVQMISVTNESADPELAQWLEISDGAEVVHRVRHMLAHDQVVQIQEAWLPLDLVQGTPLAHDAKVEGGTYGALIAAGHSPATADEHVTARMPTADEAAILQAGAGVPVLVVHRTTRGAGRQVLEALRVTATADRTALLYDNLPLPTAAPA
jgi:GntR family transcriptional regulator